MSDRELSKYPFKLGLEDKPDVTMGKFSDIKKFRDDPNWIVKAIRKLHPRDEEELTLNRFRWAVKGDDELLSLYGGELNKHIPEHHLVYLQDPSGKDTGFIAMKRVHGKDLVKVKAVPADLVKQLEDILTFSLDFFQLTTEKLGKLGKFPDLFPPQGDGRTRFGNMMWGKVDGKQGLYFVDSFPLLEIRSGHFAQRLHDAAQTFWQEKGVLIDDEFVENTIRRVREIVEKQKERNYADWFKREDQT